jgi:hypothetical protein
MGPLEWLIAAGVVVFLATAIWKGYDERGKPRR